MLNLVASILMFIPNLVGSIAGGLVVVIQSIIGGDDDEG